MFGITHVPRQIKPFFRLLRRFFSKRQWFYFCLLVLAMAASTGLKTVAGLYVGMVGDVYPQRFLDFINDSPWSPNAVLQYMCLHLLRALGWRKGMPLDIIFDGTKFRKRGKKMEAACWFHDTKIGKAASSARPPANRNRTTPVRRKWGDRRDLARA